MKKDKLSNYTVQERNANKHTARGLGMLDQSMSKDGWIGAITTANDGETFDGSARLETAYERFGEDVEPIIVESDGTRPIIVKRTDIPNAQSEQAKRLSIAANRIAAIDLSWDAEILAEIADEVDLSSMFFEDELEALLSQVEDDDPPSEQEGIGNGSGNGDTKKATLNDRFIVPPFSVLDARQGYWQERKRQWLALGIQSELGRGDDQLIEGISV